MFIENDESKFVSTCFLYGKIFLNRLLFVSKSHLDQKINAKEKR